MDAEIPITVTSTKSYQNLKRRYLSRLLGIGTVASALRFAYTAIYTTEQ